MTKPASNLTLSRMIHRMMNEDSGCVPSRIVDAAPAHLREGLESARDQSEAFLALTGEVFLSRHEEFLQEWAAMIPEDD